MKKYYVALVYKSLEPSIQESFNELEDAQLYADLMSRNKGKQYIVLELVS